MHYKVKCEIGKKQFRVYARIFDNVGVVMICTLIASKNLKMKHCCSV